MEKQILLDQDDVLADFTSAALRVLNKAYNKNLTVHSFARDHACWDIPNVYNISLEQFWKPINDEPNFWINLEPLPWYKELYTRLSALGTVTIVTRPSADPECAKQKLQWLLNYLGINSSSVFIGARKHLLAGKGILIDDSPHNIASFTMAGGECIQVPARWNTVNLTFEQVWEPIKQKLL